MNRKLLAVGIFAGTGIALAVAFVLGLFGPRERPGHELYKKQLPAWQVARFRPIPSVNGTPVELQEASALFGAAARWPVLKAALTALDRASAERDVEAFRKAAEAANRAARDAQLPYFVDVQVIKEQPVALSYEVVERVRWQVHGARAAAIPTAAPTDSAAERSIEVLRLRRLDGLNIEVAALGETQGEVPRVLLDRIEAQLADDLQLMIEASGSGSAAALDPQARRHTQPNAIDRAALLRQRSYLEERLGAAQLADAAAKLARRDKLVEEMRTRFQSRKVELARPDGFVLGEEWLDSMEPYTKLNRPGGPLMLDTDLRNVMRADEELRSGPLRETLMRAVDLVALATEAHELQHSLDVTPPPPPPALLALFPSGDERFPKLANLELRAYLAELQHQAIPPCLTISKLVRKVYGASARRTPHFFASYVILRKLVDEEGHAVAQAHGDADADADADVGTDADADAAPPLDGGSVLEKLCSVPSDSTGGASGTGASRGAARDEALRKRAAGIYGELYSAPFAERTRSAGAERGQRTERPR